MIFSCICAVSLLKQMAESRVRIDDRTKGQESRPEGYLISFRGVFNHVPDVSQPRSERIATTFRTYRNHVPDVSQPRSERITTTFRTYRNHVPNVSQPRSGRIATTFRTYRNHVPNVSQPRSERITTTSERYSPPKQTPDSFLGSVRAFPRGSSSSEIYWTNMCFTVARSRVEGG